MHPYPQSLSVEFSLLAVVCWGTSDFLGGNASKRSDAFVVTVIAHASGFSLMTGLALLQHAPFPVGRQPMWWALAGGALGGTALAIFYQALATGKMGLTAPVAAVLGAAIPTGFGMFTEGVPGVVPVVGFLVAGLGIWLISRPEDGVRHPQGLSLALLAGLGFAGFFICMSRAGDSSAIWSAALSRFASLVLVGLIVLARRSGPLESSGIAWGVVAGCLDSTGTLLFIRAQQTGRLDAAVVLTSLYPAVTVLLARVILQEHLTRWKAIGMVAAILAVPMIALQ